VINLAEEKDRADPFPNEKGGGYMTTLTYVFSTKSTREMEGKKGVVKCPEQSRKGKVS